MAKEGRCGRGRQREPSAWVLEGAPQGVMGSGGGRGIGSKDLTSVFLGSVCSPLPGQLLTGKATRGSREGGCWLLRQLRRLCRRHLPHSRSCTGCGGSLRLWAQSQAAGAPGPNLQPAHWRGSPPAHVETVGNQLCGQARLGPFIPARPRCWARLSGRTGVARGAVRGRHNRPGLPAGCRLQSWTGQRTPS